MSDKSVQWFAITFGGHNQKTVIQQKEKEIDIESNTNKYIAFDKYFSPTNPMFYTLFHLPRLSIDAVLPVLSHKPSPTLFPCLCCQFTYVLHNLSSRESFQNFFAFVVLMADQPIRPSVSPNSSLWPTHTSVDLCSVSGVVVCVYRAPALPKCHRLCHSLCHRARHSQCHSRCHR